MCNVKQLPKNPRLGRFITLTRKRLTRLKEAEAVLTEMEVILRRSGASPEMVSHSYVASCEDTSASDFTS